MGKLSKRMKRLLAILLVEVIVAGNVFISYADEEDGPRTDTYIEEELAKEQGDVESFIESYSLSSDSDGEGTSNEGEGTSNEGEGTPNEEGESSTEGQDEGNSEGLENSEESENSGQTEENSDSETDQGEEIETEGDNADISDPVPTECNCDVKCAVDGYNADCPVCSKTADAEDAEIFLDDNCKGQVKEEQPEESEPEEKKEIEPEIVEVDNSVTVTAICKADGEAIEGAESFEIEVDGTVDVLEKAPEIEGYTFAEKAALEDGSEISKIMKETIEEKEETEVDGEMAVTKVTTTTSMSYYDGTQWKDLENDIVVVFEYTKDEGTGEEETAAVKFIASFVDQDGNAIEGYTTKTLTFDDTLDLTKEPVVIENYTYVEARIDDAVVTSINKKTETDEEGEEVVTYSYTADGEDVEVTEDTEVILVYEGGEEVIAAEVTLTCVDEEGLVIEGYEKAELPEFEAELVLDDPEKAPVEVEGYEYKEAAIDGVVITALVKEVPEESADTESEEEAVAVYSYVTEDGETVLIEEDTQITLSYEESEVAVLLDATIVDEFGDEIAEKYTNMDISKIFDKNDELTLDDPETPPVKKVSVRKSLFKTIKYTYVKASVDNEIITGLKRKAIESEDAKADAEYAYSYTTDGETWKKIKEDTTVIFEYSDGKKTTYAYEDSFVSVTATLQHANAIPDDAEFVVTEISSGQAYDAYIEALNKANSEKEYSEKNTLLYDIAFVIADEESGQKVEVEPAEGSVKIGIEFKKAQLSDELQATENNEVEIKHLPLDTDVKESAGTTVDATNISASDISVENVENQKVDINSELAEFVTSGFSVYSVSTEPEINVEKIDLNIESVLSTNGAYGYGIVANEYSQSGDTETNVMVGNYSSGAAEVGASNNYSNAGGNNYFGSVSKPDLIRFHQIPANIYLGTDATNQYKEGKFRFENIAGTKIYENYAIDVAKVVDGIGTDVGMSVSGNGATTISSNGNKATYKIDLRSLEEGTYVVNYSSAEIIGLDNQYFDIYMNSNQRLVVNCTAESVSLKNYHVNGQQPAHYIGNTDSSADYWTEAVIFYCPNATSVKMTESMGVIIAPNASVAREGGACAGILVCNSTTAGNEWHYHNHDLPAPGEAELSLEINKSYNKELTEGQFTFTITDETGKTYSASNGSDGKVKFPKMTYDTEREYTYTITENIPEGAVRNADGTMTHNGVIYENSTITATVKVELNSALNKYEAVSISYSKVDANGNAVTENTTTIVNTEIEKGSITVKKVVIGDGAPADAKFYFTLQDPSGNYIEAAGNTTTEITPHEIRAGEGNSVTFTGLEYGTYTLTETDDQGKAVSTSSSFPYQVTNVTQTVTIGADSKNPDATITNTYYEPTGTWQPNVKKVFNQGNAGMTPEFTFTIEGYGYGTANNTAKVTGSGEIPFSAVTYSGLETVGTHEYTIKEEKGTDSITYDGSVYKVSVEVSHNVNENKLDAKVVSVTKDGAEYEKDNVITFTNTYQAKGGVQLQAKKFIDTDKIPGENETFIFELYKLADENGKATGEPYKTATNVGQNITFDLTDVYTQEDIRKTFWYLIKEQAQNVETGYVTNEQSFRVSVLVKVDTADPTKLIGVPTYYDGDAVFNNVPYSPDSVPVTAVKTLKNGNIDQFRNRFTFELYQITGTGENRTETLLQSVTNGQNGNSSAGTVEFAPLNYTRADIGTYTYEIREKVGDEDYIGYDQHAVTLTVVVTYDSLNHKVVAKSTCSENGGITFENEYKPTPVSVPLEVGKSTQVPEGVAADLDEMTFTFVVKDSAGNVVMNGTSTANGQITFEKELTFDKAGTYTYTIEEVVPKEAIDNVLNGITYDQKIITAVVTVEDNNNGTLKTPTVKYYDRDNNELSNPSFENNYRPDNAKITFSGTKALTGRNWLDGDTFTFGLWAGAKAEGDPAYTATATAADNHAFSFHELTFDKTGEYEYTVKEMADTNVVNGITYDPHEYHVTVKVSDNGEGKLEAKLIKGLTAENGFNFTNDYSASGKFRLAVFKTVNGQKPDSDEKFTFQLYEITNGTETPVGGPIENAAFDDAKDIVLFDEIPYAAEGSHTYMIKETSTIDGYTNDQTVYTAVVTVTDKDHNGTFAVTCQYYAGESMRDSAESGQAVVTVNNTRPSDGEALIEARKDLIGGDLTKNTFTFTLSSKDDTKLASRGATLEQTTNSEGRVFFGSLKYTRADLKGAKEQTYTYIITEQNNEETYIDYDPQSTRTVQVRVYLDGTAIKTEVTYVSPKGDLYATDNNAAVFHNTYKGEGTFSIEGTKTLTGGNVARTFTFDLYKEGGSEPVATSTVTVDPKAGAQTFKFENVSLNEIGDHTYVVKEHIPADNPADVVYDKVSQTAVYQGVTYSTKEYRVTVHMDDAGNGNLIQGKTDYLDGSIAFINDYRTSDTSINIYGNKVLTGRTGKDLQADEFTFGLYENGDLVKQEGLTNPVTNAADGTFSFHIDYTEAGSHNYVVKEIPKDALDENGMLNNIQYEATAVEAGYPVTVEVTDNGTGQLVANITSGLGKFEQPVTITNSYEDEIYVELSATKTVNGNVPSEAERGRFAFILSGDGREPQTVYNGAVEGSAVGSIAFAPIRYTQENIGQHVYTVSEVQSGPANPEAGENQETEIYEYSKLIYTVAVDVFVNNDGELDKTITYAVNGTKVDEMIFNNQKHLPAELSFRARKELIGSAEGGGTPTLTENMFQFKLTSTDDTRIPVGGILVSNNGAGEVSFTTIEYNLEDIDEVYHYTIEEIVSDVNKKPGVTYDPNLTRTITVTVGTDDDGNVNPVMTCDGAVVDDNIPLFTNKYEATGSFTPIATKTLTGRDMAANEFQFVLDGEGEYQEARNVAAANGETGTISFAPITYTLKDVRETPYIYTVSEVHPGVGEAGKPGITYSEAVYTITVTVKDNGDGTLEVVDTYSPEVNDKTMTFENTYDASGKITLTGTKTLTGRDMAAGEFHFVVMEGDTQVATGTNTNAANGNAAAITFTEIEYGLTDLGYHTYTISEVTDNLPAGVADNVQSFTVVVNVTNNSATGKLEAQVVEAESQTVAFENTYTASGSIQLEAVKTVNGNAPTRADEIFTFTLTGGYGDKNQNQSVTNNGQSVTFAEIQYDQNDIGKTFVYEVKESEKNVKKGYTYDRTVYTVEITVNRNDKAEGGLSFTKVVKIGDTTLTDQSIKFNNTYPEAGEVQLEAWKDLINGTLADGMFSFTLTGPKGINQTKSNVGTKVTFDTITYDESDVGEDYVYTITENNPEKGGVTYDSKLTRKVTVHVRNENGKVIATPEYSSDGKYQEDDDENMAIFHNTYHARGELNLTAIKNLTGRNLIEGEFDFVVIEKKQDDSQEIVARASNMADGTITFPTIIYNEGQTGIHNYVIKELSDGQLTDVTFDDTEYKLTVNVTDNHDGTLKVDYTLPTGGFVFNNSYNAKGSINLTGTKELTGRALTADDQFNFVVYEVIDGEESTEVAATGTSDAEGNITFTPINYESEKGDVRTHEYHVKEVEGSQKGIKYSKTVCTVKVSVTNNQDGTLSAVLTSDSKPIIFTNEYHSTGELQLEAWKTVNGEVPGNRVFSFILSNDKDNKTDTKSNGADGHVIFEKITFSEEDVKNSPITYTIREVIPESGDDAFVEGMNYDLGVYTVTVELTDDGEGNITVSPEPVKYVKDGQELEKAQFNNTYEAAGQVVIEASKRLDGGTLKDGQFTFILSDESGEIERVTNNGTHVVFTTIGYTLADVGTHVYTIEEIPGDAKGYTYDGTKFTVNVTVTDNGPGELIITKEYVGVDGIPEFVNSYIPKEIEISKVDAVSLNELAGASMAIIGENGETLDSWVSDGGRHVFKADYDKTYTLTETAAPAGFLIADAITFRIDSDGVLWIMQADGSFVQQADSVVTMVDEAAPTPTPTPTPSEGPTPTPGDEPTPTPGDEPTPTPGEEITPTPGNGATPTPNDEEVLGARRSREAVLGARRGPKKAVLGKRRRPATGDSLALLIWIMLLSLGAGGAVTSSTMLRMKKRDEK